MSKLTKRQEKKRQSRQRERDNKSPAKLAYHVVRVSAPGGQLDLE